MQRRVHYAVAGGHSGAEVGRSLPSTVGLAMFGAVADRVDAQAERWRPDQAADDG
ncbi:hypothetical protein L6R53_11940 [Myxococcota bacterium]|nr:hypothetical protein [Myxococcota bacterium]